ncbi:hypothetical protein LMH87_010352 [Akanthomyces muscarius]|uniref:Uncharacterized protein n=1 Tax=Akanthomyces muscarius TaxID=2231603 RepID=A0A9W8QE09_AKAMU|nr:hypothetical protein LMH87_010352 [Akanthomyces muscarius]KAJ4153885.1 hypothetical protein LMH87_010352 [Akanthomyces muscarius]
MPTKAPLCALNWVDQRAQATGADQVQVPRPDRPSHSPSAAASPEAHSLSVLSMPQKLPRFEMPATSNLSGAQHRPSQSSMCSAVGSTGARLLPIKSLVVRRVASVVESAGAGECKSS